VRATQRSGCNDNDFIVELSQINNRRGTGFQPVAPPVQQDLGRMSLPRQLRKKPGRFGGLAFSH
jgi:hypothetical protein